jgi:hypothetical protein
MQGALYVGNKSTLNIYSLKMPPDTAGWATPPAQYEEVPQNDGNNLSYVISGALLDFSTFTFFQGEQK